MLALYLRDLCNAAPCPFSWRVGVGVPVGVGLAHPIHACVCRAGCLRQARMGGQCAFTRRVDGIAWHLWQHSPVASRRRARARALKFGGIVACGDGWLFACAGGACVCNRSSSRQTACTCLRVRDACLASLRCSACVFPIIASFTRAHRACVFLHVCGRGEILALRSFVQAGARTSEY
jgi:hypothetical protein